MSIIELTPEKQFNYLSTASTIAVAIGSRQLIEKGWKLITKKDPPKNPGTPSVVWKEALLWGAFTGLSVGVLKIVARRLTAASWRKYKGPLPL